MSYYDDIKEGIAAMQKDATEVYERYDTAEERSQAYDEVQKDIQKEVKRLERWSNTKEGQSTIAVAEEIGFAVVGGLVGGIVGATAGVSLARVRSIYRNKSGLQKIGNKAADLARKDAKVVKLEEKALKLHQDSEIKALQNNKSILRKEDKMLKITSDINKMDTKMIELEEKTYKELNQVDSKIKKILDEGMNKGDINKKGFYISEDGSLGGVDLGTGSQAGKDRVIKKLKKLEADNDKIFDAMQDTFRDAKSYTASKSNQLDKLVKEYDADIKSFVEKSYISFETGAVSKKVKDVLNQADKIADRIGAEIYTKKVAAAEKMDKLWAGATTLFGAYFGASKGHEQSENAKENLRIEELSNLTDEELRSRGLIRIKGFTRRDGVKIKTHYRKIGK